MYDYKEVYVFVSIFLIYLVIPFQPFAQEPVTDFDGNNYKTVRIGDQVWMAENLRSIHDADGNKIKRVCYQLIRENCDEFGGLYAWNDLKVDEKNENFQGICPDGWHIPGDEEWSVFIDVIGGADSAAYRINNELSDFQIQYGGNYHNRLRNYNYLDEIAYYWASTSYSTTAGWIWMIGRNYINANRSTVPKTYCLSVRCVKD